ncbi:CDC15_3 [Blepharisma stoltei]|uniref:non-specific serine/threonine protein kinase n=1 Tax=Blepharisma stoltei TaxID=1481888 RepID=A0AAU9JRN2_9CILI|nr:unnamed protein product [Blepharisma stoltei]
MSKPQMKMIGVYQVGEIIGKGASGKVYKGLNTENAKIVAIKQISLSNISDDQLNSIQMEIHLLKKLNHENIVKYIDVISTDKYLNIILEYVEIGSLAAINKKHGPFHESLVSIYIKQVLLGLVYLHSQGIVHRDIKGANILATKDGIVKLTDFGVATKLSETTKSMSVVGTPYWMAPEIAYPTGPTTPACDIWSLGCTVIELVTGSPPYYDLEPMQALYRVVQDPAPPLPTNISEELKDFLTKCFQKEPLIRVDAKALLKHPWITQKSAEPETETPEEVNTIRSHIGSIIEIEKLEINDSATDERCSSPLGHRRNIARGSFHMQDTEEEEDGILEINVQVPEPQKMLKHLPTTRTASKSTKIESDDYGSFDSCLQKLRESRALSIVSEGISFVSADDKVTTKETREFNNLLEAFNSRSHNLFTIELQLIEMIKVHPKLKENAGDMILNIKEILEEVEENNKIQLALQLLSQICEGDEILQERVCVIGLLPLALRYTGEEYIKEIRIEAAYILGQFSHSSPDVKKLFLASGGIEAIPKVIDLDYKNNSDLVTLGIRCMLDLTVSENDDFLRIWASYGAIERLVITLDNINQAKDSELNLTYVCDLLLLFAKGPRTVQQKFCEEDNLQYLVNCIYDVTGEAQSKLVNIIRLLSRERSIQHILENSGIILDLACILRREHEFDDAVKKNALRALNYLLKLSPARQEQLVLANGVEILKNFVEKGGENGDLAFQLLLNIPTASIYCSKILCSHSILSLFIKNVAKYSRAIDGIANWVTYDPSRCSSELVLPENLSILVKYFISSTYFDHILQCFIKILRSSKLCVREFSKISSIFIKIVSEISQRPQPGLVKNCLDFLYLLCSKFQKPRELLDQYNLYPVIVKILHQSQDEDLVIVEEIATMILEVYSRNTSME